MTVVDFIANHGRSAFCTACFITLWILIVSLAMEGLVVKVVKWRSKDDER